MCVSSHCEDHREGKPVLARNQATNFLTKVRRKHGHGSLHKVHACRSLASVAIKRGVDFDEMRNVGDMHTNVICAVIILLDGYSIVKVAGTGRVDRENAVFSEVATSFNLPFRNPEGSG
jgi:hypothetical protein